MDPTATLSILKIEAHRYIFHFEFPINSGVASTQGLSAPSGLFGLADLDQGLRLDIDAQIDRLRLQIADLKPLEQLGRLLYNRLLTAEIKYAVGSLPTDLPLIIATNDTDLPWELLHDGQEYLALQRPLARRLLSEMAARQNLISNQRECPILFIADPEDNLNEAKQEADELIELCDTTSETELIEARGLVGERALKQEVLKQLASGEYQLIHYSGHAEPGALKLADGKLTAQEIQETMSGRPFIFLNGCQSARAIETTAASNPLPYASPATHNLVSAFILGGAVACIGTLWKVFDVSSRQFARKFYELVLHGVPVGEALRQVRVWMRQTCPDDPLWVSFVLYGDPTLRLAGLERQEIRPVTVLGARLTNLYQLFNVMPLEEAADVTRQVFDLFGRVARRYAGQVHGPLVDSLSVYFGASKLREDDAERAILAALEMVHHLQRYLQQQKRALLLPLELRLGVSTGQVLRRQLYTLSRTDDQIASQVVEIASRLATYADPNQVLVDETTHRLTQTAFAFAAVKPLILADQADTISTYQVLPDETPPPPLPRSPIVGREDQITQLKNYWRDVVAGQGGLVNIVGAAGVGKTRLVQAFKETLAGEEFLWLEAACKSYDQMVSHSLLSQLLQALLKVTRIDDDSTRRSKLLALLKSIGLPPGEELNENLALLGQVIGLPTDIPAVANLDAESRRRRLAELVSVALDDRSIQQPLVIVLEDLHWVDADSLAVLKCVMTDISRMRALVLALHRSEQSPDWRGLHRLIPLHELNETARRDLLVNLLKVQRLPQSLTEPILSRTGGNPLFVEEVVSGLQARQALIQVNDTWVLTADPNEVVPKTVQEVILARRDQLAEENEASRKVLEMASVIGSQFEYQLLAGMLPTPLSETLDDHLRRLRDQHFIYRTGGLASSANYAFYHDLTRQTIYDHLLEQVRQNTHERAAQTLRRLPEIKEGDILERIAHHYYHSNDRVQAVRYGLRAARRTAEGWAHQTALDWYKRALKKLESFNEQPPTQAEQAQGVEPNRLQQWQVEVLEGKAEMQSAIGQDDEAITDYLQALVLMVNSDLFSDIHKARLYRRIAMAHENKGAFDQAHEMIKKGFDVLRETETVETGRLLIWTGMLHYRHGTPSQGLMVCEQGIAVLEKFKSEQPDSLRDLAQAYLLQGLIHEVTGRKEKARADLERSITLYKEVNYIPGLERAYSNLGILYQDLGQWDEALRYYLASEQLSKRTGEPKRQAAAAINLGEIYRRQGKLDQAIEANQRAWQLGQKFGFAERLGLALMNIGAAYLKKGNLIEAEDHLGQALSTLRAINSQANLPEITRHMAELRLRQSRLDEALSLVQTAWNAASQADNPLEMGQAQRIWGQVYRALGQLDTADAHLKESMTLFQQQNSPYDLGLTLVELALLRKAQVEISSDEKLREEAKTYCQQAITTFDQLGAALDLQLAQEVYAS
jgi:predicted ATPase/class 3 adenylate cyclase